MAKKTDKKEGGAKFLGLAAAVTKLSQSFKGFGPDKAEQYHRLIVIQNAGQIMTAFVDLMLNATRKDISCMSINIAALATMAKLEIQADGNADQDSINKITELEKKMQNHLIYQANNLNIDKDKRKALVKLIEGNFPEE